MFHVKQLGEHMIKAVIFDYNGTLFLDHDLNDESWRQVVAELTNNRIDFDSFYPTIRNKHNYLAVRKIKEILPDLVNEDEDYWANRKEDIYQDLCTKNNRNQLNKGAEEFLNYLKENNVLIGLCTSSIISNVNFYYKNTKLDRWFKMENTIYDNGKYASKKEMYEDCAKTLGVKTKDVLVFEDSPNSIKECLSSGVENLIAIKRPDVKSLDEDSRIKQIINNFTELDMSLIDIAK